MSYAIDERITVLAAELRAQTETLVQYEEDLESMRNEMCRWMRKYIHLRYNPGREPEHDYDQKKRAALRAIQAVTNDQLFLKEPKDSGARSSPQRSS